MELITKNVAQTMRTLITKFYNLTFKMAIHGVAFCLKAPFYSETHFMLCRTKWGWMWGGCGMNVGWMWYGWDECGINVGWDKCGMDVGWMCHGCGMNVGWKRDWCEMNVWWMWDSSGIDVGWMWYKCGKDVGWMWNGCRMIWFYTVFRLISSQ